eukprot:jgi/Chrzof1/3858/Cz13g11120.t1
MCCYTGDVAGVRQCLRDGEDIHELVDLPNQNRQSVIGVTPLYLAAQQGHHTVCQLLVQNGADVLRQCCIPQTGEVFGAADIALVHFHLKTWWYLNAKKQARLSKLALPAGSHRESQLVEPLVHRTCV